MSAGPFAAGGQRRFLADEKKEDKKPQPKAGTGVFATFIKSFRDQMASKVESDGDLAAAQERLEQARLDSIKNAEAAMKRAQEAAEQASTPIPSRVRGGGGLWPDPALRHSKSRFPSDTPLPISVRRIPIFPPFVLTPQS